MGSLEPLAFEVIESEPLSNCSLRLFPVSDPSKYVDLLTPSSDLKTFPCARSAGLESYSYKIPTKFICSSCTLQLTVQSPRLVQHACAEILVQAGKSECKCQNGGLCSGDECVCKRGFRGLNCELSEEAASVFSSIFKFLLLVLSVGVLLSTIYLYLHSEVLPGSLVNFLNKHASWMLRQPSS